MIKVTGNAPFAGGYMVSRSNTYAHPKKRKTIEEDELEEERIRRILYRLRLRGR